MRVLLPTLVVGTCAAVVSLALPDTVVAGDEAVDDGGWCHEWKEITGKKPIAKIEQECWQLCRDEASCEQAVFESAGEFGQDCWLGGQAMTERPTESRTCEGCVDHCYAKHGFGDAPMPVPTPPAPSPTPTPTPVPPLPKEDVDKGGWCQYFKIIENVPDSKWDKSEESCWNLCRSNTTCMQAAYELPKGQFGAGCWLGSANMTYARPEHSRSCDNCEDHCYAKYGFDGEDPWPSLPLPPIREQTDPWPVGSPPQPPFTDYAALLDQEVAGKKSPFLSGNLVKYLGGHMANWKQENQEFETLGFTHPFYHDLRSRGSGMAHDAVTGYGHDYKDWEFYKETKVAYGSIIIDGKKYENPQPTEIHWRPDRVICTYAVGGATIQEVKFFAESDAMITTITSDLAATLEFAGQSFKNVNTKSSKPTCSFDAGHNAVRVVEDQIIEVWAQEDIQVDGDFVYNGMTMVLSGSSKLENFNSTMADNQCLYSFQMPAAAGAEVSLVWAMNDEASLALQAASDALSDVKGKREAKTAAVNEFLNNQIPYFRCPDPDVVNVYYYLWSLYYMYMIDVGKGFEQYPHTQSAANNFLGLHIYDAAIQIRVGAWAADHEAYANGNVLLWKTLLPVADLETGQLPADNMGQAWYSGLKNGVAHHIYGAWLIYQHSGDKHFLQETYQFYKQLMWKAIPAWWGAHMEAPEYLGKMATQLGMPEDADHWKQLAGLDKNTLADWIDNRWDADKNWVSFSDASHWNGFAYMHMDHWPDEYAEKMVNTYALNNRTGFWGKIPLTTTSIDHWPNCTQQPDNPDCGHFLVTPDTNYYMLAAMFKHHVVGPAVTSTLAHLKHYNMRWGFPVAPEAYDKDFLPLGDQFSNFNAGKLIAYLEGFLGLNISVVDGVFEVAENCPREWAFMETRVPVRVNGNTEWTMVRVERSEHAGQVTKTVKVVGNKLPTLSVRPWTEERTVVKEPDDATDGPRNHRGVTLAGVSDHTLTMVLADENSLYV